MMVGACALAFGFAHSSHAQSFDTQKPRPAALQSNQRRARTNRPERDFRQEKREYADESGEAAFAESRDNASIEGRIEDLSAKVRELSELLQRQKEMAAPLKFVARPMRATILEQHREARVPATNGEALAVFVRDHAKEFDMAFRDPEQRRYLAFDPEPVEVRRLLEPAYAWLATSGAPAEVAEAHMRAAVYISLLEARAHIESPEPLPSQHKLLRDLHVDPPSLAEHLRRSFLLDRGSMPRDLVSVLHAVGAAYSDPSGLRDFLVWLAEGIGSDLRDDLARQALFPYRSDPEGQFDAAAENATADGREVLKLQVELQRMLVEANALHTEHRAETSASDDWRHRLLQAERELDLLVRAADSERDAVTTLARRLPAKAPPPTVLQHFPDLRPNLPAELASDDLTTQH
jgi:hypothetical protein